MSIGSIDFGATPCCGLITRTYEVLPSKRSTTGWWHVPGGFYAPGPEHWEEEVLSLLRVGICPDCKQDFLFWLNVEREKGKAQLVTKSVFSRPRKHWFWDYNRAEKIFNKESKTMDHFQAVETMRKIASAEGLKEEKIEIDWGSTISQNGLDVRGLFRDNNNNIVEIVWDAAFQYFDENMILTIDPKVTKADAKYLKMTPAERKQHLISRGHASPTDEQCTDENVVAWFKDLGEVGQKRLRLAYQMLEPQFYSITAGSGFGYREAIYKIVEGVLILRDEGDHDNLAGNYIVATFEGLTIAQAEAKIEALNSEGTGHSYDGCHSCNWTISINQIDLGQVPAHLTYNEPSEALAIKEALKRFRNGERA